MWKSEPGASPDGSHWAERRGRSTTWKFVTVVVTVTTINSKPIGQLVGGELKSEELAGFRKWSPEGGATMCKTGYCF